MKTVDRLREHFGAEWIPRIYAERVRTQRTRLVSMEIPARENEPQISHTLLGIELRVGKRRIACPDLATARYLSVFARIGVGRVAIPYDITRISTIADDLEVAWHKTILMLAGTSGRTRSQLVKTLRAEVDAVGPGEPMPEFKQSTKQRDN